VIKEFELKTEGVFKAAIYIALFVVLYFTSHQMMIQWWQREDYNYCYLIPFVVIYLLWEKKTDFMLKPAEPNWLGIFPLVFGLLLFWLGELGGEYYTMYLSSWFVLLGLIWMHFGWQKLKIILFPIAFILTMFPPPNLVYFNLSLKLKLISSKLGVWVLQVFGKSAYREGNVIDLGFTQLQVVDACNGLRYLFPLIVLALLVSYYSKTSLWKKVLIVVTAIPISIFVNGLRIASVGLLYPIWGPMVTEGFFHDFSGWAIFMISLCILVMEMWILNKLFRTTGKEEVEKHAEIQPSEDKTHFQREPSVVLPAGGFARSFHFIAAFLLLGITAAIAQTVEFRESVPISRPFTQFPLHVGQWDGRAETMDQKFIEALDFSDYIMADYKNSSGMLVSFYTAYYESQRKGESIHSPSSCLPGGGWVFHESGKSLVSIGDSAITRVPVNRAFIQKGDYKQLSYYWFPMRGRILTNIWEMKLYNFWDALTRQRTDGALVRLITPVYRGESVANAEDRLQAFMGAVMPVLEGFLPK
jgi:exosortase D (VPLPA-CTERM-specific)